MMKRLHIFSRGSWVLFALVSLCLLIMSANEIRAQDQKIGYVNTDKILKQMPEYEGVKKTLEKLSQEWRNHLDKLDKQIKKMKKEFQAKKILYTEEVRKQKKQQIQAKIKERENYLKRKFGSDGEYFQKQKELLEPIQRKVMEAVNKIAQRKGFDFVFDRAGNVSMMYAREEWNLNKEVLIELGIDVDKTGN